jgi:hypothetical protein
MRIDGDPPSRSVPTAGRRTEWVAAIDLLFAGL